MLRNTSQFTVRFNEVDSLGIVWHGHYIGYFELGRESFGKEYGIDYLTIRSNDIVTPIIHSSCDYKLPLKYGEKVNIETRFINTQAAKIIFEFTIINSKNKVVATGKTIQVFTDLNGELLLNNPIFFEEWKKKYNLI